MQPDAFLRCIWCCYVLSLCRRHSRASAKGENIAWCRVPIFRIFDIVRVSVAFEFGWIGRSESQLSIFCSSQIPKNVLDGLPMLPSWVWHVSAANPYDMCKITSGRHHCVHDISYDWYVGYLSIELSLRFHGWSLCLIVRLTSEAELMLDLHSPCWNALVPFVRSRTGRAGGSSVEILKITHIERWG